MRVIVYHGSYGCDTGCCGHWVELGEGSSRDDHFGLEYPDREQFFLDHPRRGESYKAFACELVERAFGLEHCADLDWDLCRIETGDLC